MTEEIKEILEALKPHNNIKEYPLYLNRKQQDLLYDYITNLQREKSDICKNRLAIAIERDRLQQENKRLKEENEELNRMCELYSKSLYNVELTDYKSRCKKVNKLITDFMCTEEYCNVDPIAIAENYMEIQKALNGSDKNE